MVNKRILNEQAILKEKVDYYFWKLMKFFARWHIMVVLILVGKYIYWTWNKIPRKWELFVLFINLFVWSLAAFFLYTWPQFDQSNVTIDPYGAKDSSAKWEYQLKPMMPWENATTHWVFCNIDTRNINEPFNLIDYEGVEFYIKGNREGRSLRFTLFTPNESEDGKLYQYINDTGVITRTYWQKKKIIFGKLSPQYWDKEGVMPIHPNRSEVLAFGFSTNMSYYLGERNAIWIDEFKLIINNSPNESVLLSDFTTLNGSLKGEKGVSRGIWHSGIGSS